MNLNLFKTSLLEEKSCFPAKIFIDFCHEGAPAAKEAAPQSGQMSVMAKGILIRNKKRTVGLVR